MPSITSEENLAPSLRRRGFSVRDWEISQELGKDERSKIQRNPWWKPALEHSGPQTGVKVHLPTGQRTLAHSQDKAGVASGQVSEYPWVTQPEPGLEPDWTSLERPENSYAATLPIQTDRAWEDLQRRMEETPKLQVCQASSVIPKKTRGCNHCQRCFNKVLSKGCEDLCKCDISVFLYVHLQSQKSVFVLSLWAIVCRLTRKKQCNPF